MGDQFQCPSCGQLYALTPEQTPRYAGQAISCTNCGRSFVVPRELGEVRESPPPPRAPAARSMAGDLFGSRPSATPPPMSAAARTMPAAMPPPPSAAHFPPPSLGLAPPPASTRPLTNGVAVASLFFAVIGLVVPIVCSLVAIVLGFVGLLRTRDPRVGRRRPAMAGLFLGFVGLALGGYYISRAIPLVEKIRATGQASSCESRLRAIGDAMLKYAAAHGGQFPDQLSSLASHAGEKLKGPDAFHCPSDPQDPAAPPKKLPDGRPFSYLYVGQTLTTASPAESVLVYEPLSHHGKEGMNVLFVDGRVIPIGAIEANKATPRLRAGVNPPWTGLDK